MNYTNQIFSDTVRVPKLLLEFMLSSRHKTFHFEIIVTLFQKVTLRIALNTAEPLDSFFIRMNKNEWVNKSQQILDHMRIFCILAVQ